MSNRHPSDTVAIHPNVLKAIVRAAVTKIDGVSRLGGSPTNERWFQFNTADDAVQLLFDENDQITVLVQLVVDARANVGQTSRLVQEEIHRTLQEYVGLTARSIDIYIADIIPGGDPQ